ncbi:MAG: FAD-dependent oxidoreductase [Thermoguttaceae bacterium]|nr:FAD-dependent oxidoreductase [Thermoguttaceae bacterium]
MKRRDFFSAAALGASILSVGECPSSAQAGEVNQNSRNTVLEPARSIPVSSSVDVVVCGGGPAGIATALAAARSGAKTLILESQGCLGGTWTASCLSLILDMGNKGGIMAEIAATMERRDGAARRKDVGTITYDPEEMKFVLEEMCAKAGVDFQYFSPVVGAVKEGRRLRSVITESPSGREAVSGKVFVDCTGDGDLAAQSGCSFDFANPETGKWQPMSFIVLVTGIKAEEIRPFYTDLKNPQRRSHKQTTLDEMARAGFTPSYGGPSFFAIRDDFFALMSNHEYGYRGFDARQLTKATVQGRREMFAQIEALRKYGGPWKNIRIVQTPSLIGIREGRRIHGLYTVTQEDLRVGRRHSDAVCEVRFPIDVHSTKPHETKEVEKAAFRSKPYDIPMRALVAKDVDALMMAGRCISGDFIAHSSYRVTGNAVAMGEAAGRLAARAAKENCLPSELCH